MLLYEVDASSLAITGAQIPVEPSYLILNTAGTTTPYSSDPPRPTLHLPAYILHTTPTPPLSCHIFPHTAAMARPAYLPQTAVITERCRDVCVVLPA